MQSSEQRVKARWPDAKVYQLPLGGMVISSVMASGRTNRKWARALSDRFSVPEHAWLDAASRLPAPASAER